MTMTAVKPSEDKPTATALRAGNLAMLPHVAYGFFSRKGGVSEELYAGLNCGIGSGDDPEHVNRNRALAAETLGIEPANLLSLYQIHSAEVVTVTKPWGAENRPQADAMVTDVPGIALSILTADCGPVLFADAGAGIIGAAHAGWKGALGGILPATIDAMEELGAERSRIRAVLGPTISQDNYEVGPEFIERFLEDDPDLATHFTPSDKDGHWYFDLPGFIASELWGSGIGLVEVIERCTYQDENSCYSYRRATHREEADYGRNLSAIALKPAPDA